MSGLRVIVVGATGLVGREVLALLVERRFPAEEILLFASERSEGEEIEVGDERLRVRRLPREMPAADVVFLCASAEVSRQVAEDAVAEGGLVIDLSGAYGADPGVPCVWSGSPLPAAEGGLLVQTPGSVALLLAALLRPAAPFGIRRVVATALVSASALGNEAVGALARTSAALLGGNAPIEDDPALDGSRAFNVVPLESGAPDGRERIVEEVREMLSLELSVPVRLLLVQVPTFHGQGVSVSIEIAERRDAAAIEEAFRTAPSLLLGEVVGTREAVGSDAIHVSRLETEEGDGRWFHLWAASDNLRQGAALNAVAVAEARLPNRPGRG